MSNIRQKEIAQVIFNNGFKPTDFKFQATDNSSFSFTFLKDSGYKFFVYQSGAIVYSPAENGNMDKYFASSDWEISKVHLAYWLKELRLNLEIGDPWAEFYNIGNNRINIGNNSQEPLSDEEINFVNEKLDIILEALKEFATDFDRIKEDLEYLKSAGGKMSKKDWGTMVMGNVMGWAMSNAIHKDSLHDVWNIIIQNLGNQNLLA